jgi:hypothetical protein
VAELPTPVPFDDAPELVAPPAPIPQGAWLQPSMHAHDCTVMVAAPAASRKSLRRFRGKEGVVPMGPQASTPDWGRVGDVQRARRL